MAANATTRKTRSVRRKSPRGPRKLPRAKSVGSLFVTALDFSDEEAATILRRMLAIRRVDEVVARLARRSEGASASQSQLGLGREAVAVGACSVLKTGDIVLGDEWRHGLIIAQSGNVRAAVADWTGQPVADKDARGARVLNGGMSVAVGAALACRWNKQSQAALCFCGSGNQAQGMFHESMTLAANWKLPIVFVFPEIEAPKNSGGPRVFMQARNYGIEGVLCDGSSVSDVRTAIKAACERARAGKGPGLIEAAIPVANVGANMSAAELHKNGQSPEMALGDDPPAEPEVEFKSLRDPLRIFRNLLTEANLLDERSVAAIEKEVASEVKTATHTLFKAAKESDFPPREILLRNVYKGWTEGRFGLTRVSPESTSPDAVTPSVTKG